MVTRLYVQTFKGREITPQSMVGSERNSNPFEHLCMSSLPAKMKKIQSKMKVLEWPQHISHCESMESFPDAQGQLTPQSIIGSVRNSKSF